MDDYGDGLEHPRSNAEIATAWIGFHLSKHADSDDLTADPNWWAADTVMDLTCHDPLKVLEICFQVARISSDPWVMENLGAGPLETLLGEDPNLLDAIEIELGSNPGLGVALGAIWRSGLPDHTWQALQRLVRQSAR